MFKNSSKTNLDFTSGFKKLEKGPASASSKNIIDINKHFISNITFNECFMNIDFFDKKLFPEIGKYNFIVTKKAISTLKFLDLFENEIQEITMFITKMNKVNQIHFKKYSAKTTIFTNDGLSDLECKKLIICSTHAKTILFQIKQNYYAIVGSGNPSENSAEEQYLIINDFEIFKNIQKICL